MLKDEKRFCDVCEENIPKGTKFKQHCLRPDAAGVFAASRPDLTPTWTMNQDGTISLDVCLTCALSMDIGPGKDEIN
ncbi:hypothetical protein [Candidatus Binatus sp.]|jgi:hypothetical protein|uniref:hypothetical protein n=1 Tax=Candidatus Binatus sp. TaxID=2811406 RepID=UPI003C8B185B